MTKKEALKILREFHDDISKATDITIHDVKELKNAIEFSIIYMEIDD